MLVIGECDFQSRLLLFRGLFPVAFPVQETPANDEAEASQSEDEDESNEMEGSVKPQLADSFLYLCQAGIGEYWIIDRQARRITVLVRGRADWRATIFAAGQDASSPSLPGFTMPVNQLIDIGQHPQA